MAEGLLYNMIEKLIGKLGSIAVGAWNVRDDVEKLVENMCEIKAVILDAEQQKQGTNDHQVQLWLEKLKDALYDADDLLDDFSAEEKRRQVMTKDKKAKQVRIFFSSSNQLVFSLKMAHKIKVLRKTIEGLNVDSKTFKFTNRTPPEQRVLKQRETHSFIREEKVIGREKEKKELIELLLNTNLNVKEHVSLEESACNSIMSCSKQYRVMDLNYLNSRKIPSCIGMLKHLRYLDLSRSEQIEVLPRSITKLNNLETLLLNHCYKLTELPKDLWKMVSLQHLEFEYCSELTFMPHGIGQLTNLQTLTRFVLNTTSKHSAGASELRELNNLRKELEITGLECLRRSPTEAKDINLMGKLHLQHLSLVWGLQIDDIGKDIEKDDIILQGLLPHPNVKMLRINGFGGVAFSCSANSFTHLNELELSGCTRLQYLPQLHVQSLVLSDLPCLEWIVNHSSNDGSSAFSQSLTDINLSQLRNLKGWCRCSEEEIQRGCCHQFKSLDFLRIWDCSNLISIPQHTDIKRIDVTEVREKILQQAVSHSKVESLCIWLMDDLKSLSGVLQHLTTLNVLSIWNCEELDPCNDEDGCYSMQWKELKNLKQLEFYNIPKMEYLPEGIQHVTTLQTLRIGDCDNLTSIPEWVTSVQALSIINCPKLTSLPEGVKVIKI